MYRLSEGKVYVEHFDILADILKRDEKEKIRLAITFQTIFKNRQQIAKMIQAEQDNTAQNQNCDGDGWVVWDGEVAKKCESENEKQKASATRKRGVGN